MLTYRMQKYLNSLLLQLQVSCSFKNIIAYLETKVATNFNLEIHPIITQHFVADL